MPIRYDATPIAKFEKTPSGGVRIPGAVARVGVLEYPWGNELVVADELFKEDSVNTLNSAPITLAHPKARVTPETWQAVSIGHASRARGDESHLVADVLVLRRDAIEGIESGKLKELSCGYSCDIEHTSGEFEGKRYDAIQRNRKYNHVALGPENWGRAGSSVALRLDSNNNAYFEEEKPMATIRIDGVEYEVGSESHISALNRQSEKLLTENEKLRSDAKSATERADKAEGERDALVEKVKTLEDPSRFDSAVQARIALVNRAIALGVNDPKGTDRQIKEACIRGDSNTDFSDKSDDYIDARFDAFEEHQSRRDGAAEFRSAVVGNTKKTSKDNGLGSFFSERMDASEADFYGTEGAS
jgi:hypothetical protein